MPTTLPIIIGTPTHRVNDQSEWLGAAYGSFDRELDSHHLTCEIRSRMGQGAVNDLSIGDDDPSADVEVALETIRESADVVRASYTDLQAKLSTAKSSWSTVDTPDEDRIALVEYLTGWEVILTKEARGYRRYFTELEQEVHTKSEEEYGERMG